MYKIENNIKYIIDNYYNYFMSLKNVNGIAFGYKYINRINTFKPCLKILVKKKFDENLLTKNHIVPKSYMGIETDVIEIGTVNVHLPNDGLTYTNIAFSKVRPIEGGCSVGVYRDKGFGTICCIVQKTIIYKHKATKFSIPKKKKIKVYYILSNNHVLANVNSVAIGNYLYQPSPVFGRSNTTTSIAVLDTYIPIQILPRDYKQEERYKYINYVDCAIARLENPNLRSNKILQIGEITGVSKAQIGMKVKKFGAKTGLTYGEITDIYGVLEIELLGRVALFSNLIFSTLETEGGDSGSPIVNYNNEIIGMHLAGGDGKAIANDINKILEKLNVEIYLSD